MIRSKAFPQLVLTALTDFNIKTSLTRPTKGPTGVEVEGCLVSFARKDGRSSDGQTWQFTEDGLIRLQVNTSNEHGGVNECIMSRTMRINEFIRVSRNCEEYLKTFGIKYETDLYESSSKWQTNICYKWRLR